MLAALPIAADIVINHRGLIDGYDLSQESVHDTIADLAHHIADETAIRFAIQMERCDDSDRAPGRKAAKTTTDVTGASGAGSSLN